jgi:secretion/DNA translocation related TadE-like protein
MRRRSANLGRQSGSATVLGLGLAAGILMLVLALGALAGSIATRGGAQSAADLAALAAAGSLAGTELRGVGPADGVRSACGVAAGAAQRNGAHLESCSSVGVRTIEIVTSRGFAGWGEATAHARAGPRP